MSFCSMAPLTPVSLPGGPGGVLCAAASIAPTKQPHRASVMIIALRLLVPVLVNCFLIDRFFMGRFFLPPACEGRAPPRGSARSRVVTVESPALRYWLWGGSLRCDPAH